MDIIGFIRPLLQNPFFLNYGLVGLFLNGLLSSIIPIPTELTATALLAGGEQKSIVFIVLASGSIIGGFLAYYLGKTSNSIFRHFHRRPSKLSEERSHALLLKYGWIAILLCSWIPILGDVIPIIAGVKKYNLTKFAIAMSLGKIIKVVAIVYVTSFLATNLVN